MFPVNGMPNDVMKMRWALRFVAATVAIALAFAMNAALAADEDLPGRVGRIAEFGGDIFVANEEHPDDWTAVGLNQPVTTGDNLWVGANGRAEIDYGGGQFRLAGGSNVHVSRLDDRSLALFIAQGNVIVRVRMLDQGDVTTVDTPNTQLQLNRAGLYRIDVDPDRQTTTLVVREGEAMVALANGSQQALPGQMLTVEGADATYADVRNAAGVDGFDTWSANRDRYYQRGRSVAYVSPQMVGYADLDRNGIWETSPTYGAVWYPTSVVADWAPYRFGHWTWVSGFGYAWVDDAPWGYAPFHYGRWVFVGNRWGWCPGHYVARPVWAPALVGWYGGSGWSVSLRTGAPVYGWVPLSWGEPFHPWWGRCSHNCWTRYNRPYAVNVAERPQRPPSTYVNLRVPGAITAVTGTTLAASKPVAINRVPIQGGSPPPVLSSAPPIRPLQVATPAIRGGTGGAPKPASSLYREAKPRITPAPSAAATNAPNAPVMRNAPPSVRGAAPVAPAPGITAVPGSPSPAAAPRVVERPREGIRQERVVPPTLQAPVAPVAPPAAAPRVEPKPRVVPRQEGIAVPPTPAPSIRGAPAAPTTPAVRAAPPAPAPAVRAVPATPPPSPPPVVQRESHPRGQPAAGAEHGEKANANPRGGPQEQAK